MREIYCLNKLKHENIVSYFGTCNLSSKMGIVMELCQGSLVDLLDDRTLKLYEVSRVCKQVISGVAYLHSKNVIHRYMINVST